MERRSNYTLLNQEDPSLTSTPAASYYESNSAERNKLKSDWDFTDHRQQPSQLNRMGATSIQRQSSGSSFGESSISGGDYYVASVDQDGLGVEQLRSMGMDGGGGGGGGGVSFSSSKSWAQQTEESYQLQLSLALRLSSEATRADDPNFLDPVVDDLPPPRSASAGSAEIMSHRFWANGCLSYFDRIPDGFYSINGIDPYVWSVCSDLQDNGRIPAIESLKCIDPRIESLVEVVLIDRRSDATLKELQNRIHSVSSNCNTTDEVVDQLAKLICNRMGDTPSSGEDELFPVWKECSDDLRECLGSVVLPIGSLSVGLCRHRAILFKVLADTIDLPCRIAKGCRYCKRDDASSCVVRFGLDREFLVDLIGKPGSLHKPDSLLNGPSSISISSPLRFPRYRQVGPTVDFRSLAKQYFSDCQSLDHLFEDSSAGSVIDGDAEDFLHIKKPDMHRKSTGVSPSNSGDIIQSHLPPRASRPMIRDRDLTNAYPGNMMAPFPDPRVNTGTDQTSQLVTSRPRELPFDVEDLDIPWSDLDLKEKIGSGSFGTVHRADWNGSDVAVKILMEQDFHAERFKEFLREVAIMRRLRHPNIVLFMGAVTQPPNLSIVTEYLSRGSLYRLLHKSGAKETLDERRRLSMAYDVAKGMNYLHRRNPPIVHRDLKSPNLLVDKKYTVKVCDFGLSRLKANTYLSSKSAAGTPEWMAPEVLRDEPSNEKSDVYSFGVILWELATLQQPWGNLNPAQVVAAVGFKCKRLEIPRHVNPQVASIIEACWANEPWKRPSFASIMETLRPLIKPPTLQLERADNPLVT
ncbi:hypothetical protein DCAR_0310388 [Daucus carota subsp. sativus]|uniref:non-specific serine/threonine protein kinase n=1 Tax=Daucus carota subsp. sativus TaxID=79200 RepID=A0AAF1ASX7_DAUCS|nr:PREDICTED: serine/threonine-protein kinase CTR1 [Daucus carota subsp. sativus]WOG91140.1 hypothetical protein DCAR_0310388 [Daucus carota subsp. sativus]